MRKQRPAQVAHHPLPQTGGEHRLPVGRGELRQQQRAEQQHRRMQRPDVTRRERVVDDPAGEEGDGQLHRGPHRQAPQGSHHEAPMGAHPVQQPPGHPGVQRPSGAVLVGGRGGGHAGESSRPV